MGSDPFMIDGVDRFGFVLLHEVNFGPVVSSLSVSAWFIFFHPFLAFFLSVPLDFAEVAVFAVPVAVVSTSGISSSAWSGLMASSSRAVVSSVLSTGLVAFGPGPLSIESCDIVSFIFSGNFLLSDFVNQGWTFALELPLGHGRHLVHPLNGDGLLFLLCHHQSEFWCECCFKQVYLEKVDPHRIILSQEPPEWVVGNSSIDVIVWVQNFGVAVIEAFPDDSGSPGDAGEQLVCCFVWLHGQVR